VALTAAVKLDRPEVNCWKATTQRLRRGMSCACCLAMQELASHEAVDRNLHEAD
jgi:hypothetical protein